MGGSDWTLLGELSARYVPLFEDEDLTPALLRSFRPWPEALHKALRELGVNEADLPALTLALTPPIAPPQRPRKSRALIQVEARTNNAFNRVGWERILPRMDSSEWVGYVDKVEFKAYCARLEPAVATIETLAIVETLDQIEGVYDSLPSTFVVKSTKGSGRNLLVASKAEYAPQRIASEMRDYADKWATSGPPVYEKQYDHVRARLLIEKMVLPIPNDFKVVVFRGRCTVAWVDTKRQSNHRRNVYRIDEEAHRLTPLEDAFWEYPPDSREVCLGGLPSNKIEEMCTIARRLAKGVRLDLVRVDLFLIDGVFYGSELTLTSEAFMAHISEHCAAEAVRA